MDRVFNAIDEIKKVVKGKDEIIKMIMQAIFCGGHILLEDIPGVGKTTLALAFSKAMGLDYNRVQFTPDVLPSDISGFSLYNKNTGNFEYKPGAVMCNLLLADEINRTSPKTQAALLEVMEEGKVTVDSVTRQLPKPFTVIATQNPFGSSGTQRLPQSQLDRFLIKLSMGYPDLESEIDILKGDTDNKTDMVKGVLSADLIEEIKALVSETEVKDSIYKYIANIARATRESEYMDIGISPRGSIALLKMARASAMMDRRDYVIPEDIIGVISITCAHRVELSAKARATGMGAEQALSEVLKKVPMAR